MAALVHAHVRRMGQIDPAAAASPTLADPQVRIGDRDLLAACAIRDLVFTEDSYEAMWGALHRHVLTVALAGPEADGAFEQALTRAVDLVVRRRVASSDRSISLTWPSMDPAGAGPLVRHGFAPLTVLGTVDLTSAEAGSCPVAPPERISQAGDEHVDQVLLLAEHLHQHESRLGALPHRPGTRTRLRNEMAAAIESSTQSVLIAMNGADVVGFVQAQPPQGAWIEKQVAANHAGYVSRLLVEPGARRRGVARALVDAAHGLLREQGAEVALVHYSAHNHPAASMWVRFGYRPVLTTWTRRLSPSQA
ncbi:GNAT family N-acetyltransferase [Actinokineospora diospyrosa]|uniref:GNAT family N-acetyltransferase n=1 Tax=Actinokineospora diospyrosa TaxID=103728 RepID=UPI0031D5B400